MVGLAYGLLQVPQPGRCPTKRDLGQSEASKADGSTARKACLGGNLQRFLVLGKGLVCLSQRALEMALSLIHI